MIDPLLASCFFPVLYGRTVRIRGELYVDGGLRDNLPLEALAARGATDIIAVVTRPDGTALKHPLRKRWLPTAANARIHTIAPAQPLQLRSWDLDSDRIHRALDHGYSRGQMFLRSN